MTHRVRALLAALTAANLLHQLLFPVLALRALQDGHAVDALFTVFILPGVLVVLLGNSLLNWATPRLVHRAPGPSRRALAWNLFHVVGGGTLLLCLLLWLLVRALQPSLAPGGSLALAAGVLPVALAGMLCAALTAVAQSLYVAARAVPAAEARTLAANLLALVAWLLAAPSTLEDCAWLFTLRLALVLAALLPGMGLPRAPDFRDADLRQVLRDSRWLVLAASYYKSEPLLDRLLLASLPGGAVAAFHLAQQVMAVVAALAQRTVTAVMVPPLAEAVRAGEGERAQALLWQALRVLLVLGSAAWLALALAGEPLFAVLLGDAVQAAAAGGVMAGLFGLLLGALLGQALAQAYYCSGRTGDMVRRAIFSFTLGTLLKVAGLWAAGLPGFVAATSLAWLLQAGILWQGAPRALRAGARHA